MTTNQTIDEFNIELEKAKKKDVNIEINSIISTSVNFLDVTIANEDGHLRTSVFHKPTAEPYILPYTSDHPRHIHRNIPYAALLRAGMHQSQSLTGRLVPVGLGTSATGTSRDWHPVGLGPVVTGTQSDWVTSPTGYQSRLGPVLTGFFLDRRMTFLVPVVTGNSRHQNYDGI